MKTLMLTSYKASFDHLQKNAKELYTRYKGNIIIKWKRMTLAAKIMKKRLPNNKAYYCIYSGDEHRTNYLHYFGIDFIEESTSELNDNAYISNIHRSANLSGSDLVQMCLKICDILHVRSVRLYDGTNIRCGKHEFDLSFQKLIEKRETFYMKFGFRFDLSSQRNRYTNDRDFDAMVKATIEDIRAIEIKTLIEECAQTIDMVTTILKDPKKKPLQILYYHSMKNYSEEHPYESLHSIFTECSTTLQLLYKYPHFKRLWKLMLFIFNTKACDEYAIIDDNIIRNRRWSIRYGGNMIERKYVKSIMRLKDIRFSSYIYHFDRK